MTKPFFITTEGTARTRSPGLGIAVPMRIAGGAAGPAVSSRNNLRILAVAAAAAADNPAEALELARLAREKPDEVFGQASDEAKITDVLSAVQAAQDDPARDTGITSVHRAAAGAVGANPRLTAAASAALEAGGGGQDARLWALRLVSPAVLDNAARAAAKSQALEQLGSGTTAGTNARLQALEQGQAKLEQGQAKLEQGQGDIAKLIAEINKAIADIRKKLPTS